jgi:signal transduction histidine kinase
VTPDATRRRALGQILLLAAGFLVLVAISVSSIVLVDKAREDSGLVIHTVEVENQINTLLLEIRRAESAARGYLLTLDPALLKDHEAAVAAIMPEVQRLSDLTADNGFQAEKVKQLRPVVQARLEEFGKEITFLNQNQPDAAVAVLRDAAAAHTSDTIHDVAFAMRREEERLFAARTLNADRAQQLASLVTIAGSTLVIALAGISIFLVRRSARARDAAESLLRDNNLNLEATVGERTADLREANNEIQRFAYIVSHDLRSPLVNIMGFTSELEELRLDVFKRIATLSEAAGSASLPVTTDAEPVLEYNDEKLSRDFSEALDFIKSSIAKMDRLITAILNLTREGRREFEPVRIDTRELIEAVVTTMTHQAIEAHAHIHVEALPDIINDRLAMEQIFSNMIDNALKYLKPGVPGEITIRGRSKLGFAIFEIADNGRGIDPKDHQRIFDLFRRAGAQDKPGQGIGLAHVRALVRRLGGTMSVQSELNKGTTFTITLPVAWAASNRNRDT